MRRPLLALLACALVVPAFAAPPRPSTFSIVGADPERGEVGIAVASRFFAVGAVVPHAIADVGAVATQSYANVSYGPNGLELLSEGKTPAEVLEALTGPDSGRTQRQVGIVAADGSSVTFTGEDCLAWAGGRSGPNYACQGNILTGEDVVAAMEESFLATTGKPLAERLYLALKAGDDKGGDSRGKQSAAILVKRTGAGYGGYTDQAVDIRVDDHETPIAEIGRLLDLALVNDYWNRGWNAFMAGDHPEALTWQERTEIKARGQGTHPEVLYDLAVIRLANGDRDGAIDALQQAVAGNPKLAEAARTDKDLAGLGEEILGSL
jgi:uncharacterized Ntn-hydrolase superfamily protein